MKRSEKLQAILYARFSPRPNAQECDSIDKQLQRLRAWCVARDYEVAGEYTDADASGGTTEGREGLEAALKHVCRIRGVLAVYDLSRLSRKALDALTIAERLHRRKVGLMFLVEQLDTTTPLGRMIFTIQAGVAQYFRESAAARTSTAMREHQKNGRRMGRRDLCPFGTMPSSVDPKGLEPNPEEMAIVAKIVALHASGATDREICRTLDKEGVSRRGKKWTGAHRLVGLILGRIARAKTSP